MSDPIIIPVILEAGRDRIEITDAIAAEIVRRALVHDDTVRAGIKGLVQRLEENTKPAEGTKRGDDAIVRTMLEFTWAGDQTIPGEYDKCANILAAIRRGEVPGLYPQEMVDKYFERARINGASCLELRHKLKAAEAERDATKKHLEISEQGNLDASHAIEDTLVALGAGDHEGPRLAALRVKQERDAARASLEESRAARWRLKDMRDTAEKERDAARAEVAALKARKVKLPSADASASGRDGDDYLAYVYVDGLRNMLESCADAIRAAGVEVES